MNALTWNIEGIKTHEYVLSDLLLTHFPDFAFISEPQVFQTDIDLYLKLVKHAYGYHLSSKEADDPLLPFAKSRSYGGTLVLWKRDLDAYVSVLSSPTTAFLPILLQIPGARPSIHVGIYLPTHGRDSEYISDIAALTNCIVDWLNDYDNPFIFIRGDSNANSKNTKRYNLFNSMLNQFGLNKVCFNHPTYHHFVGNGAFDSFIDILAYPGDNIGPEIITQIICKLDTPTITSHHDVILSTFSIPKLKEERKINNLTIAPRVNYERIKIQWTEEGIEAFKFLASQQLLKLRCSWPKSSSVELASLLLQFTNDILIRAASKTNPWTSSNNSDQQKQIKAPLLIRRAKRKLERKNKAFLKKPCFQTHINLVREKKSYHLLVRQQRVLQAVKRDAKIDNILATNPKSVYSCLRKIKGTKNKKIDKLQVGDKLYLGDMVGDGFYDSMSTLKSCDEKTLATDPQLSHHFTNYSHIKKLFLQGEQLPLVSVEKASSLLKRLKPHVHDLYGISPMNYIYAGYEGLIHFQFLINQFIEDVQKSVVKELNTAHGVILYKGHPKDKNSERSYRTISTCPLLAKAIDLYLRDLFQDQWDKLTAQTQYQRRGSSHEMASLLVTETIQYSLNVLDKPVFLLVLDAQSAFDRCLPQVLCTELFEAGTRGQALHLLVNRLTSRSTVYNWDGQMFGPANDMTGFEQGGLNSADFYKLYNNEQLNRAHDSALGVNIKSTVISSVGQADDVLLCSNDIFNLKLLAQLSAQYCSQYHVKLVASKTKLLAVYHPRHSYLVEYAQLVNDVKVNDTLVSFVDEAEHVGVVRSNNGNMNNIVRRITAHKKALAAVGAAGMTRANRTNPAASLRIHGLYALPVLFSGLSSLVLSKSELNTLSNHLKSTVQNLQRLHLNTPRAVVFLLGGLMPAEAILHCRQLSLFYMVCKNISDPLHNHARHVLTTCKSSSKSWFLNIQSICFQYELPDPLDLLNNCPTKKTFKSWVKQSVSKYWQQLLVKECQNMSSLKYFKPELYSITRPHYMWTTTSSRPFESAKSTIWARMLSGRYRTEMFCRHFSSNKEGFCAAPCCTRVPGSLEHLLATCPALAATREKLYTIILSETVMFPTLHSCLKDIFSADESTITSFFLEPLTFPDIMHDATTIGYQFIQTISYISRTFLFYIHREYVMCLKTNYSNISAPSLDGVVIWQTAL